jgi:hypothetical protein
MTSTGCIYKIYCKDENINDCYIGSTKNLKNRIRNHAKSLKYDKAKQNYKVYKFIQNHGGIDNFLFEILEDDIEFEELLSKELQYFKLLKPSLNSCYPKRSRKEYYEQNKKYFNAKQVVYYYKNKEIIAEKKKVKVKCSCGRTVNKDQIQRHYKTKVHNDIINLLKNKGIEVL